MVSHAGSAAKILCLVMIPSVSLCILLKCGMTKVNTKEGGRSNVDV